VQQRSNGRAIDVSNDQGIAREKLGTLHSQTTNSVKNAAANTAGKHKPTLRERGTKN
jgi:hypothetical protein